MATHPEYADASKSTIKVNKRRGPRATLNGRQSHFIDEYMANGQNASAAYRKAYRSKSSSMRCSQLAHILLGNPVVAQTIRRKVKMLELARQNRLGAPAPASGSCFVSSARQQGVEVARTLAGRNAHSKSKSSCDKPSDMQPRRSGHSPPGRD
jgi:hypothetical protein